MADVVLDHLRKQFAAGPRAVDDLCLTIADGELIVLVGPSGCGKTTTLRLIAGLEQPTSGRVLLGGRDVTDRPPRERDVAFVFQRPALYPHLSVAENLAFGARLRERGSWFGRRRPMSDDLARRVAEAAEWLGLTELLERRPEQLSGGQQQRVALGRALVRRPAVFLLDEPLSSLGLAQRQELRRELHLLQRRLRATMVYVTHDQVEAMALGDRIVVLDGGRVQQEGRPQALYDRPTNRFVAGFLGWPPMNFLDGRLVRDEDGRSCFLWQGRHWPAPAGAESVQGAEVTLGIRPENVALAQHGSGLLAAEVMLTEPLGATRLVTLGRDGQPLLALTTDGQTPLAEGQTVEVAWDMSKAHLFDRASGMALRRGSAADG